MDIAGVEGGEEVYIIGKGGTKGRQREIWRSTFTAGEYIKRGEVEHEE